MKQSIQSYPLRLPPDLRERLLQRSQQEFRSLHSEILARLTDSLARDAQKENAPAVPAAEAPI